MKSENEVAVLFADVVGSTRLYEVLGDAAARGMILACVEVMKAATERNRGTVIKTIGDEILAVFPTPVDAVNAAAEMQHDIRSHPDLFVEGQHVAIRIGGHHGPVTFQNRDVYGASVHTANRMTSQAKAGQIICSAAMVERLTPEWLAVTRRIDVTAVRGHSEEVELFEVLWQQEDATSMLPSILDQKPATRARRLRIEHLGKQLLVEDGARGITMGRADENDVVVTGKGNLISRLHARIEVARDKFLLVDQSTNGTFVTGSDGKEAFVRRDTLPLQGSGAIGLGQPPGGGPDDAIRYWLED